MIEYDNRFKKRVKRTEKGLFRCPDCKDWKLRPYPNAVVCEDCKRPNPKERLTITRTGKPRFNYSWRV